jgi:hypothetical protein
MSNERGADVPSILVSFVNYSPTLNFSFFSNAVEPWLFELNPNKNNFINPPL